MKKKIIGAIAVFAIAAVAAFNLNIDTQDESLSAIGLANVEVLAYGEGAGITCSRSCSDGSGQCYHQNINCFYTGMQAHHCRC